MIVELVKHLEVVAMAEAEAIPALPERTADEAVWLSSGKCSVGVSATY